VRAEIKIVEESRQQVCICPLWTGIAVNGSWPEAEQRIWDWSLVLLAMHIPHDVQSREKGRMICLPSELLSAAQEQIELFEGENRQAHAPVMADTASGKGSAESVFWVLLGLAIWHSISHQQVSYLGLDRIAWMEIGRVDGQSMLEGRQWWRAVTSLTLHSGPEHLLSNLVFGGIFLHFLCRETGPGVAWSLTVITAGLANTVNVIMHGPDHLAIGASTAVFAALGLLIGLQQQSSKPLGWAFAPVGAGLALLAWLGTGGERTDVGAHFFGFAAGLAISLGVSKAGSGNVPVLRQLPQGLCGLCAFGGIVLAWGAAIIFS
jgi:membrane associated rhomboid family serine protease